MFSALVSSGFAVSVVSTDSPSACARPNRVAATTAGSRIDITRMAPVPETRPPATMLLDHWARTLRVPVNAAAIRTLPVREASFTAVGRSGDTPVTSHTVATHKRGRSGDVRADEDLRDTGEVLHVADPALDDGDEHPGRQCPARPIAYRALGSQRSASANDQRSSDRGQHTRRCGSGPPWRCRNPSVERPRRRRAARFR